VGFASCKPADTCFVCLFFVCTVTDFLAAEKVRGVKFCMCVGLLSGQVFSHFGGQRLRSPGKSWQPDPQSSRKHLYRDRSGAVSIGGGGVD